MKEYVNLVKNVLEKGQLKHNRTGVDTLSTFGQFIKIDLADGFPLLTTKKMYTKGIFAELAWMLSGNESIQGKYEKNLGFWKPWADPDTGVVSSAYGFYWRHYPIDVVSNSTRDIKDGIPEIFPDGKSYIENGHSLQEIKETTSKFVHKNPYGNWSFDQIGWILNELKYNKNNRRLVCLAWYTPNAVNSTLPPCHYTFVLNVTPDNKLNLHWTQRSCDIALGLPFNIAFYAALVHLLCLHTQYTPGELACTLIDAHVYVNHIDGLRKQIEREPYRLPKLVLNRDLLKNDDLMSIDIDNFVILDYKSHDKIEFEVAV